MSTIKLKRNTIAVSLLYTQAFCEYKLFLEEVNGLRARPTDAMLKGLNAHSRLKAQLLITKDSLISIDGALLKAESEGLVIKKKEFMVNGKTLRGRIDEIHIGPYEITIIDNKPGTTVHTSCTNQVFGYCLAFKEAYHPKQPIYGAIRNEHTGNEIWRMPFTASEEANINILVKRIQGILNSEIRAIPNQVPEICNSCNFNYMCYAKA